MEQVPISVGDSTYKEGDVVTVTPIAGDPFTGTVISVQAIKGTYRYVVTNGRGGTVAAPERLVKAAEVNGGKRKGKSRRRKGKSRRTRRTFSR